MHTAPHKLLGEIVDNLELGIAVYKAVGDELVLFCSNPAASVLLGVEMKPLHGKTLHDAFPGTKNTDLQRTYLEDCLEKGNVINLGPTYYEDSQVKRVDFVVRAMPILGEYVVVIFELDTTPYNGPQSKKHLLTALEFKTAMALRLAKKTVNRTFVPNNPLRSKVWSP